MIECQQRSRSQIPVSPKHAFNQKQKFELKPRENNEHLCKQLMKIHLHNIGT